MRPIDIFYLYGFMLIILFLVLAIADKKNRSTFTAVFVELSLAMVIGTCFLALLSPYG